MAETLITLGIIGVVAAIVMPMLITKYKQQVTINRLKEAYSIFSQVVADSVRENGEVSDWEKTTNVNTVERYLLPYMKGVRYAKSKKYEKKSLIGNANKYIQWNNNYAYDMPNGMTFSFSPGAGAAISAGVTRQIAVDINGEKAPNRLGNDVFVFKINSDYPNFRPACLDNGHSGGRPLSRDEMLGKNYRFPALEAADGACNDKKGKAMYAGQCCGALIMMDGWKISKDYPWKN